MGNLPGVFTAQKKDKTEYYRVSITYKNKHISLGSYDDMNVAAKAYETADNILRGQHMQTAEFDTSNYADAALVYPDNCPISFEKWIILINFRDNGIYFKTPIYLFKKFFLYFLSPERILKFDVDDLFYYSRHKIMSRGGYLFVNDYGMQVNILTHYGIKSHAVCGRDYIFANGDCNDFRYTNINIINRYYGVQCSVKNGRTIYKVKIHIKGDYAVGTYYTENEAAVAYNKAVDLLASKGIIRNYPSNYIEDISPIEYAKIYNSVRISKKLRELPKSN